MDKKPYCAPKSECIDISMEGIIAASNEEMYGGEDD